MLRNMPTFAKVLIAFLLATLVYVAGSNSRNGYITEVEEQLVSRTLLLEETSQTAGMLVTERDWLAYITAEQTATIETLQSEVESLTTAYESVSKQLADEKQKAAERAKLDKAKAAQPPQATPSVSRSSSTQPIRSGAEQWRALVAKHFPAGAVDEALYIIGRESGGNPSATNGSCIGLFQLASLHFKSYPEVDGRSAEGNIYIASRLWTNSGNSFVKHWYAHTSYPRYRS